MQKIRSNIDELAKAKSAVTEHCMCAKLIEEADRFIVMFPAGYQVDAAQMRFGYHKVSKTKALQLLLNTMEKYWSQR